MQLEHSGPRVASFKMLENIKEEKAPLGLLMKILNLSVETVIVYLRSFKFLSETIEHLGFQLVLILLFNH
jgi:hypothetical protein